MQTVWPMEIAGIPFNPFPAGSGSTCLMSDFRSKQATFPPLLDGATTPP